MVEALYARFESIFSKVQKRALSEQEQERLRQEVSGIVKELVQLTVLTASKIADKKIAVLEKKVDAGFEAVEIDVEDIRRNL